MLTRRQTLLAGTAALAALAFGRLLRPLAATAAISSPATQPTRLSPIGQRNVSSTGRMTVSRFSMKTCGWR